MGVKITQEEVIEFLKKNEGEKFTAEKLGKWIGLGMSIYPDLRKLRKDKLSGIKFGIKLKGANNYKEFYYWYENNGGE